MSVFEKPGRFFRGNLHTHSTRSDGALEPAEVCRRYRDEGYEFLALTDHFIGQYDYPIVDTRPFRKPGFSTIFGAEVHSGAMENGELWHILAVGLPLDFEPSNSPGFHVVDNQETGPELAARARAAGAYVVIAHPEWSGMTINDARSIEAAHAVETYNHGCAVGADRANGFHTLDLLLSEGRKLDLCATDDAHFSEPDHFGGWVMVKAEENDPYALVQALIAGDYYSSQGPQLLGVHIEDNHVIVESTEIASAIVQGHGSAATATHGNSMTRCKVGMGRAIHSPWLRVSIKDAAGRRAWSNPIWRT